jgi:subfamily B ATP-binding cassette protein MsbA
VCSSDLKNISSAITNIQRGIASGERIFTILETEVTITEKADAIGLGELKGGIIYQNVSFKYAEREVLKNINLTIPKGKMVALVGQSGAGKTTMADLLPRFYDVTKGSILIDGVDIRDVKLASLNGMMGIVTQESILFNDTVFNNIAFGMHNVSEEAVIEAAKIANAHEFIVKMENGYQTSIGDRGGRLSGGQRQRLGIARAMVTKPKLLVLDEATSAMDGELELNIGEAIQVMRGEVTIVMIAHRLSTIRSCDVIFHLSEGELTGSGNFEDLKALVPEFNRQALLMGL